MRRLQCCVESYPEDLCPSSFKARLVHRCHQMLNHDLMVNPHRCFRCKQEFRGDHTAVTV